MSCQTKYRLSQSPPSSAVLFSLLMASSSSSSLSNPPEDPAAASEAKVEMLRKIRSHEVAIAELNHLRPSRAVYQKNGNIFFRTSIKAGIVSEQKHLDMAKAQLQELDAT